LGPGADRAFAPLVARLRDLDIPIDELKDGVLERIGDTVTPQPVLAVAAMPGTDLDDVRADGLVLVAVTVRDPGNAGTLLRSGEAAGAAGVLFCGNSVDPHAPKVVRSSGGAVVGIPVVEADDPAKVLDALAELERRYVGRRSPAAQVTEAIKTLAPEDRRPAGKAVSDYKAAIAEVLERRREAIAASEATGGPRGERLDLTAGGHGRARGH